MMMIIRFTIKFAFHIMEIFPNRKKEKKILVGLLGAQKKQDTYWV